jgi:hypothetical protein
VTKTGAQLAAWMPAPHTSHREAGHYYAGTNSPMGCGGNSIYWVTWHLSRHS